MSTSRDIDWPWPSALWMKLLERLQRTHIKHEDNLQMAQGSQSRGPDGSLPTRPWWTGTGTSSTRTRGNIDGRTCRNSATPCASRTLSDLSVLALGSRSRLRRRLHVTPLSAAGLSAEEPVHRAPPFQRPPTAPPGSLPSWTLLQQPVQPFPGQSRRTQPPLWPE